MPEYLTPGVYVEEIDTGSKPIEGVSTSTAGMIGVTERGPANVPILVTSVGEFHRWFGGPLAAESFRNSNGYHCYLPDAVEGFFTNGGQRLYVTRVLREDATKSAITLFDRGDAASVSTSLLKSASEGSGTQVNTPLLSLLAPGSLSDGDWIRIGNGSQSEFRQIVGPVKPSRHVPLNLPLSFAHEAGSVIQQIPKVTSGSPLSFTDSVEAGTQHFSISGTAAALNSYDSSFTDTVLEIGDHPHAEHRMVTEVSGTGTTRTVTLSSPLSRGYAAGTAIQPLKLDHPVADIKSATLETAASGGDTVVFGDDLDGSFDSTSNLIVIGDAGGISGTNTEVRRIGTLHSLQISGSTYASYSTGSSVERVTASEDNKRIQAAPANSDSVTLQATYDTSGLVQGQKVTLTSGSTSVERTIKSIDPVSRTIVFTSPAAAQPAGAVLAVSRQITGDTKKGDRIIALDTRLGLKAGDIISVGEGLDQELITISSMAGEKKSAPDAGSVVLSAGLTGAHQAGAKISRQIISDTGVSGHPVFLVVDTADTTDNRANTLFVTGNDSFTADTIVRISSHDGGAYFHRLTSDGVAVTSGEVELSSPLERSHEAGSPVAQRAPAIDVSALDAGSWGNRIRITAEDESNGLVSGALLSSINSPTDILLSASTGIEPGTVLEISGPEVGDGTVGGLLKVSSINRANNRVALATPLDSVQTTAFAEAKAAGKSLRIKSREFRLTVLVMRQPDPATPSRDEAVVATESFANLSMDPRHSRYFVSVIGDADGTVRLSDGRPEGSSWYIRVSDVEADQGGREAVRPGPEVLTDLLSSGRTRPARFALRDGDDSISLLDDSTYIGTDAVDPEDRTGLQTLKNIEDISIVAVPGRTGAEVQGALISHCESMRYRFAVLDAVRAPNDSIADVRAQRQQFDTKYAALYHPWLLTPAPSQAASGGSSGYPVPPSGHIIGIYARTDVERGVHKAPANAVVRGAIGLQRSLSNGEHDVLNPSPVNINVIRDFRSNNRGIRVWGGRVITSDSDWKYVNVRRLMIFIEHSMDRSLQWVVFEPNAEPLWARVRRTISDFLTTIWRNGGLEGATVEEAFFVKCDRSTMTQTDIDNGRLVCVVGVAPTKPAEFVVIQVGLWTAHADNQ